MAIRVTQQSMYNTVVSQMQSNLAAYMESNEQGSTQKKINRPSDDPAGTYRVLMARDDISATKQYQSNVDTATGWLELADNVLGTQLSTAITSLKSLAEQASTGTYSAENRQQIADQAREIFGQILNLSNTQYEDKSIFAGQRYTGSAFEESLALTSWDENWDKAIDAGAYTIQGASDTSMMVQFTSDGTLGTNELNYRWSKDGGTTWSDGTVAAGSPGNCGRRRNHYRGRRPEPGCKRGRHHPGRGGGQRHPALYPAHGRVPGRRQRPPAGHDHYGRPHRP